MSELVLQVEHLSKMYRLGEVGTGTLSDDIKRWFYKVRGKEDPFSKVGEKNVRSQSSDSNFVWVLNDINFSVTQGEVIGIIGKNGAGKSTLLKILSKITGPTKGQVRTKGRVASLLEVGTGFHPELTGRENIYLNGSILGMNKKEISSKLDEIVDFAGVERYLDTPVKRYSSGMKVRLGFAVAANLEPEILIVDEVLAVGDAEFQSKAVGKMKSISQGNGRTVLFVSHNMGSIKNLCSRTLLLEDGEIVMTGDSDSVVEHYLSSSYVDSIDSINLKDRQGLGNVLIKDITFLKESGKSSNEFISGEQIKIIVNYAQAINSVKMHHFIFGIAVYNSQHELIAELNCKINNPKKDGDIICSIDKNPLKAGSYFFTFTLQGNNNIEDQLRFAKKISILNGPYYSDEIKLNDHRGVFFVDHNWDFK